MPESTPSFDSLAPPSASAQERSLEQATARLADLSVAIGELWNPATCPTALLPWLAWALSVDEWDDGWPEAVCREVVARSFEVHRRKGTPSAVHRTLGALGVSAEITEWFQQEPPGKPHTFELTAWANTHLSPEGETVLNPELYGAVTRAVDATKPLRSRYTFRVGALFSSRLGSLLTLRPLAVARFCMENEP